MTGQQLAAYEQYRIAAPWQRFGDGFESPQRIGDNWARETLASKIADGTFSVVVSPYTNDGHTLYLARN